MDLAAAVQSVVDELDAAGIRATNDGRNLNPPCVLVRAPILHFRFGKPTYDADMEVWALVPASGTSGDLKNLGDLVVEVTEALSGRPVTATPDEATLADGGTAPMYRLTWTQRIPA